MVWAVYAPTTRAAGFLAGTYAGASAEVTVGGGIGAVALRVVHGQLSIRTLVAGLGVCAKLNRLSRSRGIKSFFQFAR
jgi:hypothetical protein